MGTFGSQARYKVVILSMLDKITVGWFVAQFKNIYIACYNPNDDQIQAVCHLSSAIRFILLSTLVYSVEGEGWLWKGGAYDLLYTKISWEKSILTTENL